MASSEPKEPDLWPSSISFVQILPSFLKFSCTQAHAKATAQTALQNPLKTTKKKKKPASLAESIKHYLVLLSQQLCL